VIPKGSLITRATYLMDSAGRAVQQHLEKLATPVAVVGSVLGFAGAFFILRRRFDLFPNPQFTYFLRYIHDLVPITDTQEDDATALGFLLVLLSGGTSAIKRWNHRGTIMKETPHPKE
jgi:hypothetical protein